MSGSETAEPPKPSAWQLFFAFTKIGMTSFGGGVSGWMRLEFVVRKRWISLDNFFVGVSLAQALPGVNVLNLAIWVGFELLGTLGAIVAAAGVLLPPMLIVILLAEVFERLSGFALTNLFLGGVAVAGLAMALSLGLVAARRRVQDVVSAIIFLAAFCAIFVFHLSMIVVLAVLTPISIGIAYWKIRRDA